MSTCLAWEPACITVASMLLRTDPEGLSEFEDGFGYHHLCRVVAKLARKRYRFHSALAARLDEKPGRNGLEGREASVSADYIAESLVVLALWLDREADSPSND